MLTNYPGICRNLYLPDYTLFDLETTGVSCRSDDVVEQGMSQCPSESVNRDRDGLIYGY